MEMLQYDASSFGLIQAQIRVPIHVCENFLTS